MSSPHCRMYHVFRIFSTTFSLQWVCKPVEFTCKGRLRYIRLTLTLQLFIFTTVLTRAHNGFMKPAFMCSLEPPLVNISTVIFPILLAYSWGPSHCWRQQKWLIWALVRKLSPRHPQPDLCLSHLHFVFVFLFDVCRKLFLLC